MGGIDHEQLMIDEEEFVLHDFRNKFVSSEKYSLAMSLECAEHIPEGNADDFIDTLTELSDVILFSGAIPHQRGRGHINEQYPSYWVDKFAVRGYEVFDIIRRKVWNDNDVRAFYAQNIFLYIRKESEFYKGNANDLSSLPSMGAINIVNPRIWEDVNNYKIVKLMDALHENKFVAWIYYKFIKQHINFN